MCSHTPEARTLLEVRENCCYVHAYALACGEAGACDPKTVFLQAPAKSSVVESSASWEHADSYVFMFAKVATNEQRRYGSVTTIDESLLRILPNMTSLSKDEFAKPRASGHL